MLSHIVVARAATVPAPSRNRAKTTFEDEVRRNRQREQRRLDASLKRQKPLGGV